jgi:hypothetical protein
LKPDDPDEYVIQVSQWETFIEDRSFSENAGQSNRNRFYTFNSFHKLGDHKGERVDESSIMGSTRTVGGDLPKPQRHRRNVSFQDVPDLDPVGDGPYLSSEDLWEKDDASRQATREGYSVSPDWHEYGGQNMTEGLGEVEPTGMGHRRRANSLNPGDLLSQRPGRDGKTSVIKDRLNGYVRRTFSGRPLHNIRFRPKHE